MHMHSVSVAMRASCSHRVKGAPDVKDAATDAPVDGSAPEHRRSNESEGVTRPLSIP
jgi:hypothetical protein